MAETIKKMTTLDKAIVSTEVKNHELLKLAYDSYLANARLANAHTKTRGEVSGGGIKPWKQKGTGRARFGSSRNPIWRKGGIVFGPTGLENYKKRLNVSAKRVALRQALSLATKADKIVAVDTIEVNGRTKDMVAFIEKNKLAVRRILVVVDIKTPEILHSCKNLQSVEVIRANYLTVYHILNADKIIITSGAAKVVNEWLGGTK